MINLVVDTSYKSLYIGVLNETKLVDQIQMMSEFNFSETLIPKLDELFKKNNLEFSDIDKIFATVGPGSFTGIRIGLTVCKTLSFILKKDIVPISSLEFMATTDVNTKYVIPFIDARHSKVFGAVYDNDGNSIVEDSYCDISELINKINDSYTLISYDDIGIENVSVPNYNVEKIIMKHLNDTPVNCHELKPNYLKKTEAEEKLK